MSHGRPTPPADLIELGAVRGAFGVKGWVRIAPHTMEAEVLRATKRWWVQHGGAAQAVEVTDLKRHGGQLLAKWAGYETPEAADELKGAAVAVAREDFPPAPEGTHYWADLIGATVVNRSGEVLGTVRALSNNGAHDLLEVADGETIRLVPMIESYVEQIDVPARTIRVDWQRDW